MELGQIGEHLMSENKHTNSKQTIASNLIAFYLFENFEKLSRNQFPQKQLFTPTPIEIIFQVYFPYIKCIHCSNNFQIINTPEADSVHKNEFICMWWDFQRKEFQTRSADGKECWLQSSNQTHAICECTVLNTNFALASRHSIV